MSTPIQEKDQYSFPAFAPDPPIGGHNTQNSHNINNDRRSSDEDGTLQGQDNDEIDRNHLRVTTSYVDGPDHLHRLEKENRSPMSLSQQREQTRRLDDDLEMLRAERVVSIAERTNDDSIGRTKSMARSRSRTAAEPVDDFDVDTTPLHEKTKIYKPPAHPTTKFAKIFKKIHNSVFLVRWFFYITPLTLLLLIPTLFGLLLFDTATVGDVELFWFGIWLEIVWLTLWLGRVSKSQHGVFVINADSWFRSLQNVCHTRWDLFPVYSQTAARNGGIWEKHSRCLLHCSSGVWQSRSLFCQP